jgi:poly-gamma-glutamate capsule biosynthesis protein CapA/YwtB (metallophosphatase superfamily)
LREYKLSAQPESLVATLRPLFADADIVLVNAEGAIGSGPTASKCTGQTNCYAFRSPPGAADALRSLGSADARVVANVANNHSHDAGNDGFASTQAHLKRAGVLPTGVDTLATVVVTSAGDTLAFLGFYTGSDTPDARDIAAVRRHVARAVQAYGTVVVTAHIGAEGVGEQHTRDRTEYFLQSRVDRGNPVAFAHAAFESGATLVVGHGPHVLRAAEWVDDRLVLYSLGNLLSYGTFSMAEPMNRGAVACVDIAGRKVMRAELRPTMQRIAGVMVADPANRAMRLIDSLSTLDFPQTGAKVLPSGELVRRQ